jgi:hypothetical protein
MIDSLLRFRGAADVAVLVGRYVELCERVKVSAGRRPVAIRMLRRERRGTDCG